MICETLAARPPLGWNSYDAFNAAVTEEQVRQNADVMAAHLAPLGYEYVVVDYCWYYPHVGSQQCPSQRDGFIPPLCMDEFGRCVPAPDRFPSAAGGRGFTELADYVHGRGLKFGIHVMRGISKEAVHRRLPVEGTATTADRIADPATACRWLDHNVGVNMSKRGAQAYYDSVFRLYASWGVDYVKVDDMVRMDPYLDAEIEAVHAAVARCGRPMVLSLSAGVPRLIEKAEHVKAHSHLWRISDDFWDEWRLLREQFEYCERWQGYGGPDSWLDVDMLTIGKLSLNASNGPPRYSRFSDDELLTMLSLWYIFRSPLMIGGDLRQMRTSDLDLLCNGEALAANQRGEDPRELFRTSDEAAWWSRAPDADARFLALFNLGDTPRDVSVRPTDIGLDGRVAARDVWQRRDIGVCEGRFTREIRPHGAGLYRLSACRR
ncbi:MAG: alpha-galactosidase [Phycisphaeraceae bacterium]|nr:alpha-galactosidase [Phycisphaeraceae bacterium]